MSPSIIRAGRLRESLSRRASAAWDGKARVVVELMAWDLGL